MNVTRMNATRAVTGTRDSENGGSARESVLKARKSRARAAQRHDRCERVAWPKLFGTAGATRFDPKSWIRAGSGGTGDLDTNRGPPIPTPNAKNPTRARVHVGETFTLSRARARAKRDRRSFCGVERAPIFSLVASLPLSSYPLRLFPFSRCTRGRFSPWRRRNENSAAT